MGLRGEDAMMGDSGDNNNSLKINQARAGHVV